MRLRDLLREITLPLRSPAVLMAIILFFGLLQIVLLSRALGLVLFLLLGGWLLVFVLPALLRYLMVVLRARAVGREPEPVDIELFPWIGHWWAVFPIVHVVVLAGVTYLGITRYGSGFILVTGICYALVLPASLITLAITRSPLASLNARILLGLVRRRGFAYLVGPLFALGSIWLVARLDARVGVELLTEFTGLYLLFAAFALFGGLVRPLELEQELDIPLPAPVDAEVDRERLLLARTAVLNHAYGIISRGNRNNGLQHIYAALDADDDESAWAWFFTSMLQWENPEPALVFAQRYLHELLRCGENVKAVKLMLRCRLVNPAFKPWPEDIELAAAAAENCQNDELASFLR